MSKKTEQHIPFGNPVAELLEDLIADHRLTQTGLAAAVGTTPAKINDLLHDRRPLSAEMALRLGRYFCQSPQFWLNLQTEHQLRLAEQEKGDDVRAQVTPRQTAA